MASAGTIYLDAQIDTGKLKKQVTSLGKMISKINIQTNVLKGDIQKQLNAISKSGAYHINAKVNVDSAKIKSQLNTISKNNNFALKVDVKLSDKSIQKQLNNYLKKNGLKVIEENAKSTTKALNEVDKTYQKINKNTAIGNNLNGSDQIALLKDKMQTSMKNSMNSFSGSMALNMVNTITNTLASGSGSIIQGITSILGSINGTIANMIIPGLGNVVSLIYSILGNMARIVVNIVKGIINTSIKIVKSGIQIIKNMFNFISDLPSFISKVVDKLGNMSLSFRVLGSAINYCNNLVHQFASIIGQKFSAYSIINFVKESFELGSSLTEQYHILKVVTPSFTKYTDELTKASEYSEYMSTVTQNLGISTINATKYIAGYASMWKSLGVSSSESITSMSKDMLQLTSDIASFKDMDYADVYKSLKSVIFGGQTRTGLNLGVDIYVSSMKEYANSVGKVWDNMNGAEKSALRLEKVMKDLNFMYGDFSKTSYTWANQTRVLKEQLSNLKAVIGENLIMVFNNFLIIMNKCLSALTTLSNAINGFLKSLGLGKVLESAGANISSALEDETESFEEAADNVGTAGSNAAKNIQGVLFGFDKLLNNISKDSDTSGGSDSSSSSSLIDLNNSSMEELEEESETILNKAITNLKNSIEKISKFFNVLWEDFNTYFANPFAEFLKSENGIPRLVNVIADLIDNINWNKINVAFRRWFDSIEPIAEFFFNVGVDIQQYFINPLIEFWSNNILTGILDTFTKFNNAVNWQKIRNGITNVLNALEPLLETLMSTGLWILQNILEPIGEWFLTSVWPILSDVIANTLSTINAYLIALKPYWEEFYNSFLVPFASILGDTIIAGLTQLNEWLSELKNNLNDETWVENTFGFISEDIQKLKSDLENFDIGAILTDLFNLITKLISTADENFGISNAFKSMLNSVITIVKDDIAPFLLTKIQEIWENDIKPNIPSWINKIWEFVQPYIEKLGTWIVEKLVSIMVTIIEGQATFIAKIANAIGKSLSKMFLSGSEEESNAKSLGETIVDCIINGFKNYIVGKVDDIYQSLKGVIESAIDKFKNNPFKMDFSVNSSNPNDTSSLWTNTANTTSLLSDINVASFANGGYVHHTPGGSLVRVAEAGQSELIFGDSKLRQVIREEFNGYGSEIPFILQLSDGTEIGSWIIDVIKHEVKRTGKSIF